MNDAIEQFRREIEAAGLPLPARIEADGRLHRFSTNGKHGDDSGWYVLYPDGVAAGSFGCWRAALSQKWRAHIRRELNATEKQANRERMDAMKAARDADEIKRHAEAAIRVAEIWERAQPASPDHPYAALKGVSVSGLREHKGRLVIPMRNATGALCSLQFIAPDSEKRFLTGGRVKGCFHMIGEPGATLCAAEGYATAASIHAATGHAVAVAFNAGNLPPVAQALRARQPDAKIIICGDADQSGTGQAKALEAAKSVGGSIALPTFTAEELAVDKPPSDFNDLAALRGLEAVAGLIRGADCASGGDKCAPPAKDTGASYSWPEPTPLPDGLPPVHSFDAELLPEALRAWVMDIAHRMQCPPDFPAVAALVALSSLIGARAVIQPKVRDDWQVVPNLWGAVVGRPGVKKSPALSEALKPLNRLQAAEFESWRTAHESWEMDCRVIAMQGDANERDAKKLASKNPARARELLAPLDTPPEPIARRYIVNDATVEKLGELIQQNEWGVLSYRDELYGLLTGLDKQGQEGARAFYLQGYDGNQGYTFDRIMRGTVHIPRVCLSMIGGIQPGKIQEYVRGAMAGGSADDGLLQRFGLTVWPDVAGDYIHVDQWPDTPAKQAAWAVFERLAQLQPESDTEPVVWRFSDDAQDLFVQWLVPFETKLRGDDLHPAMVSHLAKYRKLIPALALVFALIDTPDSGNVVHERELLRALAWGGDYLPSHANRLYSAAMMPETTNAATLLSKIKGGKLADSDGVVLDSFTPRQVAVKHWAGLATPDAVRKAAGVLTDYDCLRRDAVHSGSTGGRPSDRYLINPVLLKGGAA